MTGLGSCSSRGKLGANLLRRAKGEPLRSTRVCTLVVPLLVGHGGIEFAGNPLRQDPAVLKPEGPDSRLGEPGAVDETRRISGMEPAGGVGVTVAEFRIVPEADGSDGLTKPSPEVSELPEELVVESLVPGEVGKKDDRDELDVLFKRVVCGVVVGWA